MDREIRDKWCAALRSGKYEQGVGRLQSVTGKFCCLGVLADVVEPDQWDEYHHHRTFEPGAVYHFDHLGLPAHTETVLLVMNDHDHKSFNQIADFIEATL
jgi:hypothetical protein